MTAEFVVVAVAVAAVVGFVVGIMLTDKVTCPGCWGTGSNGVHMSATGPCEVCGGTGRRPE